MFPYEDSKTVSLYPEKWNHTGFVIISPTLVINGKVFTNTSYSMETQKVEFFFKKVWNWQNWILSVPREKKSPWLHRYQSYISNWYINGKVFTSITAWKPKKLIFFKKVQNWQNWILSVPREMKLKGLHEYYSMETQKFDLKKKVWNWILTCISNCAKELKSP